MKTFLKENLKNIWFWAFTLIAVATFFAMPLMSRTAGNTGDEDDFQIPQGENVINYYKTHGADSTCLDFKENLQYYGASFDVVTAYLTHTFNIKDISTFRHKCNAFVGWMAILAVGLLGYQLGGFRIGVFAMLMLFLSPRFLGHAFNNPKDIPFASAVIFSIFGMVLFFKQFPKVKWYTFVILTLSLAAAISVRIGGLLLFCYFGLFGLIYLIKQYHENRKQLKGQHKNGISFSDCLPFKLIGKMAIMGFGICILGYFLGLLLWPYALQAPIQHPIEAFKLMSSFDISIRQLFEGQYHWSDQLMWYYTPKYILITIPLSVILGLIFFFLLCWKKKENRFYEFMVVFTFVFPIFWIIITHANIYGGWRHAIFTYPPMVVASAWGFDLFLRWIEAIIQKHSSQNDRFSQWKSVISNTSIMVIFFLLTLSPIRHIFANHPYEYIYFNELAGGTKKAFGNYEMDYYYTSMREASEWVIQHADKNSDGSKVRVATWHTASANYYFRNDTSDFKVVFARWYEKESVDWDYAIFTITGINPEYLQSSSFPPANTVKTIEVDGAPIAIVLKRQDKNDYRAYKAKDKQQYDSAKVFAYEALATDPTNMGAMLCLGEIYGRLNMADSSLYFVEKYLKNDPEGESALYLKAYAYVIREDYNTALKIINATEKINPKFTPSRYLAIQIHMHNYDFISAKREFEEMMEMEMVDNDFVNLWIQYSQRQGIDPNTACNNLYRKLSKVAKAHGKKKMADAFMQLVQ